MAIKSWRVEVAPRAPEWDVAGRDARSALEHLGLRHVTSVASSRFFLLKGALSPSQVEHLARTALVDPLIERYRLSDAQAPAARGGAAVDIYLRPGVTDPVADTVLRTLRRVLRDEGSDPEILQAAATGRRYELVGCRSWNELEEIAKEVLFNACVEEARLSGWGRAMTAPPLFPAPPRYKFHLRRVRIRKLDDDALARLSAQAHLFLSLDEMRAIHDHYVSLRRDPTDLELETLAQTWSEHCVHKTLKSAIDYEGTGFGQDDPVKMSFDNLLKDTIMAVTRKLDPSWCWSVFIDNAGIIEFDEDHGVAFKVETHNHPSAIEPYGGAATGIGGCIRDIMGCGLGAQPIAATDVFCLADPGFPPARLPAGVLHPRRVFKGVVAGVRDYGNRMGIPTVNGAVYFDDRYLANPLVFCGCVGLIPKDRIHKEPRPGDAILVAGGGTGRDGIHGATFSSAELSPGAADEFSHAVQIGNPIEQKKLLDAMLRARDVQGQCLYSAVTDCGAGGLSSAVGEMGEKIGAEVDLEKVPLKYAGLRYDEIWISEAQERMVFAVPPDHVDAFIRIFEEEEVKACVIGRFTDDKTLRVRYRGKVVGELDMGFLHEGLPKSRKVARWRASAPPARPAPDPGKPSSWADRLLECLSHLNVASKEWVIRQYDHEVQGRSVVKPLVGPHAGPSDAAVLRPRLDSHRAIALGCGLCPHLSDRDPYGMAIQAVDEALRNVLCVGGHPRRTALLDNFCWPQCQSEDTLGALVRACRGAADAAEALGLPFISGKDSLNNQFTMPPDEAARLGLPERLAIPDTLLISAISVLDDARRGVSMDLKLPGHCLVAASAPIDKVGFDRARALHHDVAEKIASGKVFSAHDVSDGGLLTALAETCIASGLGLSVDVDHTDWRRAPFEPRPTTYLLEMAEVDARECGYPIIAQVLEEGVFQLVAEDRTRFELPVESLTRAWKTPLQEGGGDSSWPRSEC